MVGDDGVMENPWESMLCMYSGLSWALAKPVPIVDSPQSEAEAMVKIGTGTRDPPHPLIAIIRTFTLEFTGALPKASCLLLPFSLLQTSSTTSHDWTHVQS